MTKLTEDRKKELVELARAIDRKMAPLRNRPMTNELVELNTQRGALLNELYGQ
jgi:hypothetical protein